MGDIRAGLEELKLDGALFANVKYYVSGEGDPKVRHSRVFVLLIERHNISAT